MTPSTSDVLPSRTRFDLFTVPPTAVPGALWRMAADRAVLGRQRGLAFHKLLGTGDGRTFDVRDADLRRWALLTVWDDPADAVWFARPGGPLDRWRRLATEHWWVQLGTRRSRGTWAGRRPFRPARPAGDPGQHGSADVGDHRPVVALTRARLRWSAAPTFWRAVPAVNADLSPRDGLLLRIGVGEAPVGLQGTFSVWRSADALRAFAYRGAPHRDVIDRSSRERWYTEELFARFAVVEHGGTVFGADPLGRR